MTIGFCEYFAGKAFLLDTHKTFCFAILAYGKGTSICSPLTEVYSHFRKKHINIRILILPDYPLNSLLD